MRIRVSIRTFLLVGMLLFATFIVGNRIVNDRVASISSQQQFEKDREKFEHYETPELLQTEAKMKPSIADYFLMRRKAKLVSKLELVREPPYDKFHQVGRRLYPSLNRIVKSEQVIHVSLFYTKPFSRNYIGLDSPVWLIKEDGLYSAEDIDME